jgi:hypothetical protein
MTKEELDLLLILPEHKFIKIQALGSRRTAIVKCSYPLTMITDVTIVTHVELVDGLEVEKTEEVVTSEYAGNDYVIVEGKTISNPSDKFVIAHVLQEVPQPVERITDWVIQKIDFATHDKQKNQESRITDLNAELDLIWKQKDSTLKTNILLEEYLAKKILEAQIIDEKLV